MGEVGEPQRESEDVALTAIAGEMTSSAVLGSAEEVAIGTIPAAISSDTDVMNPSSALPPSPEGQLDDDSSDSTVLSECGVTSLARNAVVDAAVGAEEHSESGDMSTATGNPAKNAESGHQTIECDKIAGTEVHVHSSGLVDTCQAVSSGSSPVDENGCRDEVAAVSEGIPMESESIGASAEQPTSASSAKNTDENKISLPDFVAVADVEENDEQKVEGGIGKEVREEKTAVAEPILTARLESGKAEETLEEGAASTSKEMEEKEKVAMPNHADDAKSEKEEDGNAEDKNSKVSASSASGEGDDNDVLYPMMVTGPGGEKVELMVLPTDTVMDIRQFLADAPETCFYTCYDLILTLATGMRYQLMDYLELSEVCDVAAGGCTLEMIDAFYDDRTVRSHVRRTRDLISTSNIHTSLSTKLAMEFEKSLANGKDIGAEDAGGRQAVDSAASKAQGGDKGDAGGGAKLDNSELDGLGFMEDPAGRLLSLLVTPQNSSPEGSACLEKLAFSSLNPVPGYRRLQGDILYLDVVTLEGKKLCITAHQRGFFLNRSNGNILNPEPASPSMESTTLVGLFRKASEKFTSGFSEVWERKGAGHQFENMQLSLPPNPWLGAHPPPAHVRDVARSEEALLTPYGTDVTGIQRDWNEELQSCRELPRETLQDRIIRDRALYKVSSDFVDSAIKGAKAVIGHSITPINPTDPERFHMYVHNGIFFSFAVDGDFVMIQQRREEELKQKQQDEPGPEGETAHKEDAEPAQKENEQKGEKQEKDKEEVVSENKSESSPRATTDGAAASNGDADASLTGAKQAGNNPLVLEGEQATYASANNDLKGTRAFNTADVSGLYTLAMAIVDYRGYRVVAQSIIPGILYGDKSASLLYGSVDGGKRIAWNEKFHLKMCDVGKVLHIAEHTVEDGSGSSVKLCGPVECKGIIGSDDRHYILDLMRTSPRDIHYTGPNSRLCVLRPELVAAFCQNEAVEKMKDAGDGAKEADVLASIALNPNAFTDFKVTGDDDVVKKDAQLVQKAGEFLLETVVPKLIQDFSALEVSPMDGQTLTEALHAHGVNIRYLGKIASLSDNLLHIKNLCISEMIARSAKHVLKAVLRETLDQDVGGAVSHFLNCFLGTSVGTSPPLTPASPSSESSEMPVSASSTPVVRATEKSADGGGGGGAGGGQKSSKSTKKKKKGGKGGGISSPDDKAHPSVSVTEVGKGTTDGKEDPKPGYTLITSELVWGDIMEGVKFKYQYELTEAARNGMRKLSALRSFCQKMGITIAARDYNLDCDTPFAISDILDLNPSVKHCAPNCSDARDLMDGGKIRLSQGKIEEALELFLEAVAILQQVCGPLHREVANCCRYLAMAHYHKQDLQNAVVQQHKELIINERVLGVDHPDTAHSYGNMALFYHGLGHTELALKHMQRTLHLLNVACGPDHPDVAATFINVAMMYQDIQKMHVALRYLQEALMQNERLLGPEHLQTAVCFHALAIAFNCMGAYKLSLQHERSTYNILLKQLGEDDPRTKDSAHWLRTFQIREVQAQKQRGQAAQQAAAQKAAQALQARSDLVTALAAASSPPGARGLGKGIRGDPASLAASVSAAGGGMRRGMGDRAQKAAAEVRRRAAARGMPVSRAHGSAGHGPGSVPLDELLSFINGAHGAMKVPSSGGLSKGVGLKGGVMKGEGGMGAGGLVSAVGLGGGGPGESSHQGERKGVLGVVGGATRSTGFSSSSGGSVSSGIKATPLSNGDATPRERVTTDQAVKVPQGLGMGLGTFDADAKKKKAKAKKAK